MSGRRSFIISQPISLSSAAGIKTQIGLDVISMCYNMRCTCTDLRPWISDRQSWFHFQVNHHSQQAYTIPKWELRIPKYNAVLSTSDSYRKSEIVSCALRLALSERRPPGCIQIYRYATRNYSELFITDDTLACVLFIENLLSFPSKIRALPGGSWFGMWVRAVPLRFFLDLHRVNAASSQCSIPV